ncbi:MAG: hypothetical protein A2915_04530 [Candidatus Yanofskybacteria bacterium RIFCSPLOWO2_01_FULL_41_34]|uniref:Dipeptidylpeptidase IV N-terminal domain-containing protein n=1 Tax=Candidatus Yanofskybacteria bacterium RIFCSPHIGHO2_01_FULL_41_26 TaxID=1802661 RepID=A0A1F8EC11_9BACT|nr:MAG: hypothetical protein A2649_03635 [Candidatus Yanofskybacteria bacterium RIFCSPHIGHO2_01_FULL_41_26]OGN21662.1 MAG: hypothetical protein A2915_04530 [Candidatus Yanofskybacteria bacterium RIFCSPLOWO2_01_FULL_41_34]
MNQKLLTTLTVLSITFTAFLAGYLISQNDFYKSPESTSTGNILDKFSDQTSSNHPGPEALLRGQEDLRLLSPRSVASPVLSKDKDSVIYYEKDTGRVFETTTRDVQEKLVSEVALPNLIKTSWSPSRKEVISLFYHPSGDYYRYYNYKTKTSVNLGTAIKSLAFSPDGSRITYFGSKDGSQGFFISQPDGSSFKKILSSRLENAEVYWSSEDLIYFKTGAKNGSELYSLSMAGEIKKILNSKDGLEVKWSRDGSRILFSQKTELGTELFYKDISSESETSLEVATNASKCDWEMDGKIVVCGVSRPSSSGDEIYEIGLDGTKKLISSPAQKLNISELFLSDLDDHVVILNALDNKLYVLKK